MVEEWKLYAEETDGPSVLEQCVVQGNPCLKITLTDYDIEK
jgi:hypothetical protein